MRCVTVGMSARVQNGICDRQEFAMSNTSLGSMANHFLIVTLGGFTVLVATLLIVAFR